MLKYLTQFDIDFMWRFMEIRLILVLGEWMTLVFRTFRAELFNTVFGTENEKKVHLNLFQNFNEFV